MEFKKLVADVIVCNHGAAKAADIVRAGVTRAQIKKLVDIHYIERISQGYYKLKDSIDFTEERIILTTIPSGVVSLESALFHYGYSDFAPRKWTLTLPRSASRRIADACSVPLNINYVQDNLFDTGITKSEFNGINLFVYDRERTICDCFKHRAKIDTEIFNKAVNAYVIDDKKNLANLSIYAKKLRVYTKVMDIMEVMLNA